MAALLTTDLPFPVFRRGKVRDVYALGERLLIVATDRISAFDCVMPQGIPDKGRILTAVANYWFEATKDLIRTTFELPRWRISRRSCRPMRSCCGAVRSW